MMIQIEQFYMQKIQDLQNKNKELKDTLTLERERYRGIVTELEVELDKYKEDEKTSKDN
tara:strand:+ start:165 stop:341 length:177 start_codon:yes stop_codon:yes gene_type:complete